MYQSRPNVAMIEVGIAMAAMMRRPEVGQEQQNDERGEDRADDQVLLDVVDRRFDEVRGVAHDADVVARRQRRLQFARAAALTSRHDLDGVGARLPADLQQHGAGAVDVGERLGIGLAVFDARDVADADRMAVLLADDDVAELGDGLNAAARAQRDRLRALIDAAAGNLDVLPCSARDTSVTVRL